MQSLPQSVKNEIMGRLVEAENRVSSDPTGEHTLKEMSEINYRNQFCLVYPDNTIYAWVPSANDTCSNDWIIL